MTVMKTCSDCGEAKPLIDFPVRSQERDGRHYWCFDCKRARHREYSAAYRQRDPERSRRAGRRYQRANVAKYSEQSRKQKFGLDNQKLADLLAEQGNCCKLCRDPLGADFTVDHDHACCDGRITCGKCTRGILCRKCNNGLGMFNDDPELLISAALYVISKKDVISMVHIVDEVSP